jgi:hypothetical protein
MGVNFDGAIDELATTDYLGEGLWVLAGLVAAIGAELVVEEFGPDLPNEVYGAVPVTVGAVMDGNRAMQAGGVAYTAIQLGGRFVDRGKAKAALEGGN